MTIARTRTIRSHQKTQVSLQRKIKRAKNRVNRYLDEQIAKAKKAKEIIAKLLETGTKTGTGVDALTNKERYDKAFSVIDNFFNAQEALIRHQRKIKN